MKVKYRTSVTADKELFELFKDICKNKYDKEPTFNGLNDALISFIQENRQYLEPKYSKIKEILE